MGNAVDKLIQAAKEGVAHNMGKKVRDIEMFLDSNAENADLIEFLYKVLELTADWAVGAQESKKMAETDVKNLTDMLQNRGITMNEHNEWVTSSEPLRRVAKAVMCPICSGSGWQNDNRLRAIAEQITGDVGRQKAIVNCLSNACHGCHGTGWVTIYDIQVITAEPAGGD